MDQDMGFIKVLGGLKSEPTEIKMDPEAVEIGIDDILDSSDEEIDTKDEQIKPLHENKETISRDIENVSPNNSEKESTAKVSDETQTEADSNASTNLQSDEIFVLNFGKIPAKPKEADRSRADNSNRTTDVSKEVRVIQPPQGSYMCHICQLKFKQKRELSDHMKCHLHAEQMKDDMHTCNICEKTFTRKNSLERHKKQFHNKDKLKNIQRQKCQKREHSDHMKCHLNAEQMLDDMHICNICEKTFRRKDNLKRHKNFCGQMLDDMHTCNICEKAFSRKDTLQRHTKRVHNKDETQTEADSNSSKNLQAYNSNRNTDCSKELKEVIVIQPPEESTIVAPHEYTRLSKTENICNHCQHTTNNIHRLLRHIRQSHRTVTKMNQCPYCPYKSKWNLRTHLLFKHKKDNEIQWFKCHLCPLKFKEKRGLFDHIKCHLGARPHTCNICEKAFKRKDQLQRHTKLVHNKDKLNKIQCQECDYVTTDQGSLTRHFQMSHTDLKALPIYQCEKCQFKTRNKCYFYLHKAKHKTELICESCGFKTNSITSLKLHHLTHKKKLSETDLKFKCDRCDYKTYRQYSFQVHKLKHLKPDEIEYFYCYHCDFKANRKDNLKAHVLRHFKKEEVKLQCYLCEFSSKKRSLFTNHINKEHPKVTP